MKWLKLTLGLVAVAALALIGFLLISFARQLLMGGAIALSGMGEMKIVVEESEPAAAPSAGPTDDPMESLFSDAAYDDGSQISSPDSEDDSGNVVYDDPDEDLTEVPVDKMPEDMPALTQQEIEALENADGSD